MKKAIAIILILISLNAFSQANTSDSLKKAQIEANKFIDSLTKHTTIADFREWLYNNVTAKNFTEGKFADLYNFFLQAEYQKWMEKTKKK